VFLLKDVGGSQNLLVAGLGKKKAKRIKLKRGGQEADYLSEGKAEL